MIIQTSSHLCAALLRADRRRPLASMQVEATMKSAAKNLGAPAPFPNTPISNDRS